MMGSREESKKHRKSRFKTLFRGGKKTSLSSGTALPTSVITDPAIPSADHLQAQSQVSNQEQCLHPQEDQDRYGDADATIASLNSHASSTASQRNQCSDEAIPSLKALPGDDADDTADRDVSETTADRANLQHTKQNPRGGSPKDTGESSFRGDRLAPRTVSLIQGAHLNTAGMMGVDAPPVASEKLYSQVEARKLSSSHLDANATRSIAMTPNLGFQTPSQIPKGVGRVANAVRNFQRHANDASVQNRSTLHSPSSIATSGQKWAAPPCTSAVEPKTCIPRRQVPATTIPRGSQGTDVATDTVQCGSGARPPSPQLLHSTTPRTGNPITSSSSKLPLPRHVPSASDVEPNPRIAPTPTSLSPTSSLPKESSANTVAVQSKSKTGNFWAPAPEVGRRVDPQPASSTATLSNSLVLMPEVSRIPTADGMRLPNPKSQQVPITDTLHHSSSLKTSPRALRPSTGGERSMGPPGANLSPEEKSLTTLTQPLPPRPSSRSPNQESGGQESDEWKSCSSTDASELCPHQARPTGASHGLDGANGEHGAHRNHQSYQTDIRGRIAEGFDDLSMKIPDPADGVSENGVKPAESAVPVVSFPPINGPIRWMQNPLYITPS